MYPAAACFIQPSCHNTSRHQPTNIIYNICAVHQCSQRQLASSSPLVIIHHVTNQPTSSTISVQYTNVPSSSLLHPALLSQYITSPTNQRHLYYLCITSHWREEFHSTETTAVSTKISFSNTHRNYYVPDHREEGNKCCFSPSVSLSVRPLCT